MRNYLTTKASWWLLVLIYGGGFWILDLIGNLISKALAPSFGWPTGNFHGLIAGVLFGLFMATLTVGARGRSRRDSEDTDKN
jgi:hypothetical protein